MLLAPRVPLEQIAAQAVMKLRGGDRFVEPGAHDEIANVGVGFEQHRCGKQHVVDSNHAVFVQLHIVQERRAAPQREVQRVVEIVIQVRARRDDEVHQPAIHQLDHAAAEAGRRHGSGNRQPDCRVALRGQHLVCEDLARLGQAAGVERLKSFVDQTPDIRAAGRPVIANGLARQELLLGVPG
jgi:hypothetical protein